MRSTLILCAFLASAVACSQSVGDHDSGVDVATDHATSDTQVNDVTVEDIAVVDAASDVPVTPDVTTTDVATGDGSTTDGGSDVVTTDSGVCAFGGVYEVMFMGMTVYFRFTSDGLWQAALGAPTFDQPNNPGGTWSLQGNQVTIRDDASDTQCPPTMAGVYNASFASDCSVQLTAVSDPCSNRQELLTMVTFVPYTL